MKLELGVGVGTLRRGTSRHLRTIVIAKLCGAPRRRMAPLQTVADHVLLQSLHLHMKLLSHTLRRAVMMG
jgi:hypothetical protein